MKAKIHKHTLIYYLTVWFLSIFFVVVSFSLIFFQTPFGKEKIKTTMINFAKKNNLELKIDKISGALPFQIKLSNVEITKNSDHLKIEKLDFRIRFFPLLNKKLAFRKFLADTVEFSKKDNSLNQNEITAKRKNIDTDLWISPGIEISFDNIKISDLKIKVKNEDLLLNISGNISIEKNGKYLYSDLNIIRKDIPNKTELDLKLKANKATRYLDGNLIVSVDSLKVFYPFIEKKPFDTSLSLDIDFSGKVKSFLAYFSSDQTKLESPIKGKVLGKVFKIENDFNKEVKFLLNRKSELFFDFITKEDLSISIYKLIYRNDLYKISLDSTITKNFDLESLNLLFRLDELKKIQPIVPFDISGALITKLNVLQNKTLTASTSIKNFIIDDYLNLVDFKSDVKGTFSKSGFWGNFSSSCYALNQSLNMSSNISYSNKVIKLDNFSIVAPSSNLLANVTIDKDFIIQGNAKAYFNDFSQIGVFYPKIAFDSEASIDFNFSKNEKNIQSLKILAKATNFRLESFFGNEIDISLDIFENPFSKNPLFNFDMLIKEAQIHELNFSEAKISSNKIDKDNFPFTIEFSGDLKKPVKLDIAGFWNLKNQDLTISIDTFKGLAFEKPFSSQETIKLELSKDLFKLSNVKIEMDESTLAANIDFKKDLSKAEIKMVHFPLDFLSVNPLDLDVFGFVDLDLNIQKSLTNLKGNLDIQFTDAKIFALFEKEPLYLEGTIKADFLNNYVDVKSDLNFKNSQNLSFIGKIPINISFIPFDIEILNDRRIDLKFDYIGKSEEILDFIDIGPQRLEGDLKISINLTDTLKNPIIDGFFDFQNGFYENYYTGTSLQDINAHIKAQNKNTLKLEYLNAKDYSNGSFEAFGSLSLDEKKNYPFKFTSSFNNLTAVNSNMIDATASGNFELSGNSKKALAKGIIDIDNLELLIPSKLPVSIPNLNPIFTQHPYQKTVKPAKLTSTIYPIELDLAISSKNPIKVSGQGLTSTWKGDFKIDGTYTNVETVGSLDLIEGTFSFAGRKFTLFDGKVMFTGVANEMPNISIKAKMNQQGIDIIANMQGPLDRPKISFSSEPPLPSGSIMSLLLFGQELSDLDPSQIVQLSNAMTNKIDESTLTGQNSPQVLGVDRFNVVQPSTSDPNASDQVAIQLGKYITKGIVVSFSQGEEQGSSNIIIEVDLKHGFIFQAETQQQEEQGKFSLKWRHNY
ncbi:MAG: translocation/assembly module TamB domain-containing protein [Parachlamydiales bacterium]|nr:translocation/assembly module TamB domain-containing protein [Parachlamydiales bacterium]